MSKTTGPKSRARTAPGQLFRKASDLLDLISVHDKSAAIAVLRGGLVAKRRFFDGKNKKWTDEPDYRVRHESAMAILAYAFGKPIERQITATGTFQELSEILSRINASPEAMREVGERVPRLTVPTKKP